MDAKQCKNGIKVAAVILGLIGLIAGLRLLGIQDILRQTLDRIAAMGPLGPIAFITLYILACLCFVPGSILTLGAGFIFGVFYGTVYVSIASIGGATLAFLVGRYALRAWVAAKIRTNPKFDAIDGAVGREGWKIVALTRLSPVFPFNLLNYAYGITKVSLRDYFWASWIGMLPGTVMYVYAGSLAGSLTALDSRTGGRSPAEWLLYAAGLLATLGVTVYVTKLARKALQEKLRT